MRRRWWWAVWIVSAFAFGCETSATDDGETSHEEPRKRKKKKKKKKKRGRGESSAVEPAKAPPPPKSLSERFDGSADASIKATHAGLGIPSGWKVDEFGIVEAKDGLGAATARTLPVWPPVPKHVKIQTAGHYCYASFPEGTKGKLGAKHHTAYFWELDGKCDAHDGRGKEAAKIWVAATDERGLAIVYIKKRALSQLEPDIASILKPFGS